jgi:TolB-like protein/DNA-binding winged helix-turn-helix (wHTH) protein/Tfp pilus assembly protein PilF
VRALRFGAFELELSSGELRRSGVLVHLQQQPAKVLALLARRSGELVTREEIQREVWGETFVDFEQGLNYCVKQIRSALGDQADTPRYLETLPRRGYRFLAPVEGIGEAPQPDPPSEPPRPRTESRARPGRMTILVAAALLLVVVVGAALARRPAVPPPARVMLVVLPFENLSGDPAQEFLSDGLTEELTTALARLRPERLAVIARTSANVYKKTGKAVDEIGRELGVDYLVEGSVRREGDRLRVAAQLVRATDQTHLWAESYDRPAADTLALQDDVARRVVAALEGRLLAEPAAGSRASLPKPAAAYDAYLKARYELARRIPPDAEQASPPASTAAFEQAIALDPAFAPAWAGLASAAVASVDSGTLAPSDGFERARTAATKALALDETLAEAHVALAAVALYHDWRLGEAGAHYERALALDPGRAASHHAYAGFLSAQGRHDEAIAAMETARRLDPLSAAVNGDVGWYFYMARRYDEAIACYRRTLKLEPGLRWVRAFLVDALGRAGKWSEARDEALVVLQRPGLPADELERVRRLPAHEAVREFWRATARRAERSNRPDAEFIAVRHAQLGDGERALEWLRRAVELRSRWLIALLGSDPAFDPWRSDARFLALREQVGLGNGMTNLSQTPSATRPSS